MRVKIYTDGACSGNPGKGGYGIILRTMIKGQIYQKEFSQGYSHTTNNRMELMGVIEALKKLKKSCEVQIYSDSSYVVDAINKNWLNNWQNNNWRGGTIKNIDLWQQLIPLLEKHQVEFFWIKGHDSNEFNNRCDELAVQARLSDNLIEDKGYK